ncbi:MAG TPA: hypothetical protein VM100_14110 [Longimicrobiales bacterium]|nr:hypothetical protein [Longimicrobiales bacterium]
MKKLLASFDVDYAQWRMLVKVALKHDMRRANIAMQTHGRLDGARKNAASTQLFVQFIFYALTGGVFAVAVSMAKDQLLAAGIVITYAMFMTAIVVLLDYSTIVTSPDDYLVLGFQPISSRTFFAARITNLLIFILAVSTAFGLGPFVAVTIRARFNLAVGAALLLGIWLSAITVALLMVSLYGVLLRTVSPPRLMRALSYLQLVTSFVVYGGYIVLPRIIETSGITSLVLPRTFPTLLIPSLWFAGFSEVARGSFGFVELMLVVASLAAGLLALRIAAGRLSLEFSERIGQLTATSSPAVRQTVSSRQSRWSLFPRGEARAVWLLVRGQFRSDQRFRMSVLAIVPMTVLYFFMSLDSGGVKDPFLAGRPTTSMVYMAITMFPLLLVQAMSRSENFRSAWIFFATPVDRQDLVLAMKNSVFISFVVPYLMIFCAVLSFLFRNFLHAFVHTVVLGLIAHAAITLLVTVNPALPFATPQIKGERTASTFILTLATMLLSVVAIPLITAFVYISALRTAVLIIGLWAVSALIEMTGRSRMRRLILESEFTG